MNKLKRIIIAVLISCCLFAVGITGYVLIEGWNFLDAFYMTIITLTAVGFGEVHRLGDAGRIFTIILIFFGFGLIIYVATAVVQLVIDGKIREILGRTKLRKKISTLKDHYIICGYGRIGRTICGHMKGENFVVIEKDEELIRAMEEEGILYIRGDAIKERELINAGIKYASGVIAALKQDADNVFLVLTVKQLNPDIFIVARAGDKSAMSKMRAAGADMVESPYETGARIMAQRILRPAVTNFLDLAFAYKQKNINMEELFVSPESSLSGFALKDSRIRENYDLIIIAMKADNGEMFFNPSSEALIIGGSTVIVIGERENISRLEKVLSL